MNLASPLAFLLAIASAAVAADEPIKKNPQPRDFLGKWTGKWDGTWKVQFTISEDPKTKGLSVLYEWEESLGKPLQKRPGKGRIAKDTLISGNIEITLSADDPERATATGKFKNPREAELKREDVSAEVGRAILAVDRFLDFKMPDRPTESDRKQAEEIRQAAVRAGRTTSLYPWVLGRLKHEIELAESVIRDTKPAPPKEKEIQDRVAELRRLILEIDAPH